MNNTKGKAILTTLVLSAMAASGFAAGVNNTVDPNATGYGAESYGKDNAITATGTSAFAVGFENTVSGANSLVYGHNNKATGANSFAGGENSEAKGYASLAIGSSSQALKDYTFAIGSQARAAADNTVAIGNGAYANKDNALAVGAVTSVDGKDSIALGSHVKSHADNNVAIGTAVTTNSSDSVGIGTAVTTNSNNSVGIGNHVTNNLGNSIGIGNGVATDFNTIGIGNGVETKVQDTIAIGNGVISDGESSVAIGNAIHAEGVKTVNIGTNVNAKGVSSIVIGRDTTVNGDDSTVVGANNGFVNADQSVVVGYNNVVQDASKEQLIFGVNSTTKEQGSTVVGSHSKATAVDSLALGNNTIADVQNGVAIGTNSVTESPVGTTNIKDNTTDIRFSNSTYAGSNPDSVVSFGTHGRAGAGGVTEYTRQLQNLAAGRVSATSTDGINGSQLYDVALEAQKHNTLVDGTNTTVTSQDNNFGRKEYKVNVNRDLTNMNSVQFNTVNDPQRNYVSKDGMHVFDGDVNTNYASNGIKIENTDNLDTAEYNMDGININSNGKNVRFGTDGITAGGQIINGVKEGVAGTDAVNVKQMKDYVEANKAVESVITDNQVDNIAAVRVTNGKSTGDANAQYGIYVSKNTVTDIAKAANKFEGDSVIKVETTTGANHTADTTTFKFDGNEAAKVLPVSYKANGGTTNKVMADKGLNFVNGNHINASVGADGLVRFDLDQNIPNQINSNANAINGLSDKVAKNHKISERGIAGTAALAALHPLDFDPDHKLDVMAGYGHFHGSNSVALGAAYRPNEDLMFTVGSTVGNGDTVVNAGVSYKVGAKSGVSRSKVAVAKDVADMKREMEAMKAQNAKITAILNAVLGADLPQDQNTVFPDVPENHWAFEAVDDLAKRGLIIGYEDGMFKGDRVLTRYEFAEVVHRAIQRAKEINAPIDGRLVDEFKPELLRFEVEQNGKLERVHALKSNKDIKRDSYGSIVK